MDKKEIKARCQKAQKLMEARARELSGSQRDSGARSAYRDCAMWLSIALDKRHGDL